VKQAPEAAAPTSVTGSKDADRAATLSPTSFSTGALVNSLKLPVLAYRRFEFGEHAEHIEERLCGRRACTTA